eukprot:CAMPEP_0194400064 /NCGR_PEP_ID=MMETSP0174-20130528/127003_1 /TAXON_ID=216777 /ORGANISM="Proboscia alata, Strain PI-D3" /LENGTH=1563 /DNA_ID=CAMNT_0039196533 /DNA_START=115 /DNA_END=4803 /DNA_ORIENTATION=-
MWGSTTFADLAKKAKELQETVAAESTNLSLTSPFSLDSMRQSEEEEQQHEKSQDESQQQSLQEDMNAEVNTASINDACFEDSHSIPTNPSNVHEVNELSESFFVGNSSDNSRTPDNMETMQTALTTSAAPDEESTDWGWDNDETENNSTNDVVTIMNNNNNYTEDDRGENDDGQESITTIPNTNNVVQGYQQQHEQEMANNSNDVHSDRKCVVVNDTNTTFHEKTILTDVVNNGGDATSAAKGNDGTSAGSDTTLELNVNQKKNSSNSGFNMDDYLTKMQSSALEAAKSSQVNSLAVSSIAGTQEEIVDNTSNDDNVEEQQQIPIENDDELDDGEIVVLTSQVTNTHTTGGSNEDADNTSDRESDDVEVNGLIDENETECQHQHDDDNEDENDTDAVATVAAHYPNGDSVFIDHSHFSQQPSAVDNGNTAVGVAISDSDEQIEHNNEKILVNENDKKAFRNADINDNIEDNHKSDGNILRESNPRVGDVIKAAEEFSLPMILVQPNEVGKLPQTASSSDEEENSEEEVVIVKRLRKKDVPTNDDDDYKKQLEDQRQDSNVDSNTKDDDDSDGVVVVTETEDSATTEKNKETEDKEEEQLAIQVDKIGKEATTTIDAVTESTIERNNGKEKEPENSSVEHFEKPENSNQSKNDQISKNDSSPSLTNDTTLEAAAAATANTWNAWTSQISLSNLIPQQPPHEPKEEHEPTSNLIAAAAVDINAFPTIKTASDDVSSKQQHQKQEQQSQSDDQTEELCCYTKAQLEDEKQVIITKFMLQLQRIHESHDAELSQMQIQYQNILQYNEELEQQQQQMQEQQLESTNNDSSSFSDTTNSATITANNNTIAAQQKKIESWQDQNKTVVKELEMWKKRYEASQHELHQLQNTFIPRIETEKHDLQKHLESTEEQSRLLADSHAAQLMQREEEVLILKERKKTLSTEMDSLKDSVNHTQNERTAVQDQYNTLKARVKIVATELKERRGECRELTLETTKLKTENNALRTELEAMKTGMDDAQNMLTEGEGMAEKVEEMKEELQGMEAKVKEASVAGDRALQTYKKKAQAALASTNARIAAAAQAQEEAELSAAAARRVATTAETRWKQSESEQKRLVTSHTSETVALKNHVSDLTAQLRTTTEKKTEVETEKEQFQSYKTEVAFEMARLENEIEELKASLQDQIERCSELNRDLRDEKKRVEVLTVTLEERDDGTGNGALKTRGGRMDGRIAHKSSEMSNNVGEGKGESGMIAILQEELMEANEAIVGLKEALRNALSDNQKQIMLQRSDQSDTANAHNIDHVQPSSPVRSVRSSGSYDGLEGSDSVVNALVDSTPLGSRYADRSSESNVPLFYAMEKQAELNTAREEINRLANLVGDAEAARQDALDFVHTMQKQVEEMEAKVRRQEKLGSAVPTTGRVHLYNQRGTVQQKSGHGSAQSSPQKVPSSNHDFNATFDNQESYGEVSNHGSDSFSALAGIISSKSSKTSSAMIPVNEDGENVNLEYLKNIMLRYLNAKTTNERRTLIPVISSVLCLTSDEQQAAENALHDSVSIENVGNVLAEGLEHQGSNLW